ncbi:MAG: methyltransferase [Myxococcota bacterium]
MSPDDTLDGHAALHAVASLVASVSASLDSGLLLALHAEPQSAATLASDLALDERATELVLEVLRRANVVTKTNDGYALAGHVIDRPDDSVRGLRSAVAVWSQLPQFLRDGRGLHFHGRSGQREAGYRGAVAPLGDMFAAPARRLASLLATRLGRAATVLDVGAGSGVWSLAMAKVHDEAFVTALDLPAVTEVFRAVAARDAVADRVDTIAADYHHFQPDAFAYDRVVLANVLHLESERDAAQLVARMGRAVGESGALVIVDAMTDGSPQAEAEVAGYALHLALRTGKGRVHSETALRDWVTSAGFADCERLDLGTRAMGALLARRSQQPGPRK